MYVASDAPNPACPVFILRFVLLFSLVGALSLPGQGTCYTSLPLALTLLLGVWPSSPLVYLQYLALAPISNFSPSWPLSSQLISKTGYLLSFTLVGVPYPVGAWLPSPPGCQLPFSLTDGSSPVEALPLSLFRSTCYPSLFLALSTLLVPDLSLPLGPRIWGLRVLRCRLARTLAVIVSSAVHSSFLLSVSHQEG